MRTLLFCFVVTLCLTVTLANPRSRTRRSALPLAFPARTMLFTGYFRGQHFPRNVGGFRHYVPRNYEPEGAMTAFAAGNTVQATGSYAPVAVPVDCSQCNGNGYGGGGGAVPPNEDPAPEVIPVNGGAPPPLPEEELPAADAPAPPVEDPQSAAPAPEEPADEPEADVPEEAPLPAPAPPPTPAPAPANGNGKKNGHGKKNGNGGGKTRPRADDDDDDYSSEEDDDLPVPGQRGRGRGRGHFYNTYFPMMFGGRRGAQGPETPGVATAIANSFSQGRGAVATSHATAYGGPHMLGPGKAASRRASTSA